MHLGDIVGVDRPPGEVAPRRAVAGVDSLELLSPIRVPLPDTFHGLTDIEQRYRRRYLDLLMNEETRADFLLRARMITAVRRALDDEGFVEVETPVLQPRYGGAFARPFETHHNELDQTLYLRIATELYLKRLIVGGLERVYEIGKDFRNEGVSYKHNPEFTMLEWYEAYADYRDTMERMERLVARVADEALGTTTVTFRGHEIDLASWQRVKLADALAEHGLWTRDAASCARRLNERGVDDGADKTWAQLIDHALSHFVEPTLIQPTILYDYPVELSPFARPAAEDGIVERFEFYVGGMELGNAFTRDQRLRGAGRALRDAGRRGRRRQRRGRAGRSGLRRGALVRDASDRRPRDGDRPAGDGACRQGLDPRRDPLSGSARARR